MERYISNFALEMKKKKIEAMKYSLLLKLVIKDIRKTCSAIEINPLLYSIFIVPIFFYLQVAIDHKRLKQPFFYDYFPGITFLSNNISPETVQKGNYFPTKLSILLKQAKEAKVIESELIQYSFLEKNITNIEDFGRHLTIHFFDLWKSYKKQYFFGIKKKKTKIVVFSPRIKPKKGPFLDEFPLKVENMYPSQILIEGMYTPSQKIYNLDIDEFDLGENYFEIQPSLVKSLHEVFLGHRELKEVNLFRKFIPKKPKYVRFKSPQQKISLVCIKADGLPNELQDLIKSYNQQAFNIFNPVSKQLSTRFAVDRKKKYMQKFLFRTSVRPPFPKIRPRPFGSRPYSPYRRVKRSVIESVLKFFQHEEFELNIFSSKSFRRYMSKFVYPDTTAKRLVDIYYQNKYYDTLFGWFWKRSYQFKMGLGMHFHFPEIIEELPSSWNSSSGTSSWNSSIGTWSWNSSSGTWSWNSSSSTSTRDCRYGTSSSSSPSRRDFPSKAIRTSTRGLPIRACGPLEKLPAKKIRSFSVSGEIHYKGRGLLPIRLNSLLELSQNLSQKLENPCTNQIVTFCGRIYNPQVVNFKPMSRIKQRRALILKPKTPVKIATLTNSYSKFKYKNRKIKTRLRLSGKNFKARINLHTHPDYEACYVTPALSHIKFNRWLYYWYGFGTFNLKEIKKARPVRDLRYRRYLPTRRTRPIPKKIMRIFPKKYQYTLTNGLDYQKSNQKLYINKNVTDFAGVYKHQSAFLLPNEANGRLFIVGRMHLQEFYKRPTGIFKRKKYVSEPIHNKWWLFFVQFVVFLALFDLGNQMLDTYGRELVDYLIDFFSTLGVLDNFFKEEFDLTTETDAQYQIIRKSNIRFKDIVGLTAVFCELTEFIWFLRQKAQTYVSDVVPRGLLFVGPPGTGKTLLVKALAGEADAPLIIQASSSLVNMDGYGSQRLEKLFTRARTYSRCIIFFDEIDSIGKARSGLFKNALAGDRLIQLLGENYLNPFKASLTGPQKNIPFPSKPTSETSDDEKQPEQKEIETEVESIQQPEQALDTNQLSILTQLLIELDGLKDSQNLVVIGATNRLKVLDKALIRPGRFNRILKVGLPNKTDRIEMCQFYGQALGFNFDSNWDYIGRRTIGLSGADISTIMNQSTMLGVVQNTQHTIETIDMAINRVICQKSDLYLEDTWTQNVQNMTRVWVLAYYHTGLAITPFLLESKDIEVVKPNLCTLFPLRFNARYKKTIDKIWNEQLSASTRSELETLLLGLYAGKMSEYLFGHSQSFLSITSSLGKEELQKASDLIYRLIDKWALYSTDYIQDTFTGNYSDNLNYQELYADRDMFEYLEQLSQKDNLDPLPEFRYEEIFLAFRHWETRGWWQFQIMEEHNENTEAFFGWSRLYINAPEERMINQEWLPPDQYFHSNAMFFLTKSIHLNHLISIKRDILYQTIVSNCLKETLHFLSSARVLIDFFAFTLYHRSVLRYDEMKDIYKQFFPDPEEETSPDSDGEGATSDRISN